MRVRVNAFAQIIRCNPCGRAAILVPREVSPDSEDRRTLLCRIDFQGEEESKVPIGTLSKWGGVPPVSPRSRFSGIRRVREPGSYLRCCGHPMEARRGDGDILFPASKMKCLPRSLCRRNGHRRVWVVTAPGRPPPELVPTATTESASSERKCISIDFRPRAAHQRACDLLRGRSASILIPISHSQRPPAATLKKWPPPPPDSRLPAPPPALLRRAAMPPPVAFGL